MTSTATRADGGLRLGQIRMRDPFLLAVPDGSYRLYGTTDAHPWDGPGRGFDAYRSWDLQTWEGPVQVFSPDRDFRGRTQFWAPEVHPWKGRWLMLASFADRRGRRGSYALTAPSPDGPFVPLTGRPLTPPSWMCLDSTLHVDPNGDPWLIFAREWLQAVEGDIWAQRLSPEIDHTTSAPQRLFGAREAPWTRPLVLKGERRATQAWIADGPHLLRRGPRELVMFWSSHGTKGCAIGASRSLSGSVLGPWRHDPEPLWDDDGAHPMVLTTHAGTPALVLHTPDRTPLERPVILTLACTPRGDYFAYRRTQNLQGGRADQAGQPGSAPASGAPDARSPHTPESSPRREGSTEESSSEATSSARSAAPSGTARTLFPSRRENWGRGTLPGTSMVLLGHDGSEVERRRCEAAVRRLLTLRRNRLGLDWSLHVEERGNEIRGWLVPPAPSVR